MIWDLFSKRMKRARGEVPDVYEFDHIPEPLRVQVIHIWEEVLEAIPSAGLVETIVKILRKERGVFHLPPSRGNDWPSTEFFNYFQKASPEEALDCVELFNQLARYFLLRDAYEGESKADACEAEINARFQEHGIGYAYESGLIIRIDSKYLHQEAVKPALALLAGQMYEGANEEFRNAHGHFRHQRYKACLVDCLKALESTLKAICDERGWPYPKGATAKKLIGVVLDEGLLPRYSEMQLHSVQTQLESGVPTVRNKEGGHGQGRERKVVPEYLVRYQLNLAATTIALLASAHAEMS